MTADATTCKTPGCSREPLTLSPDLIEVIGESVVGFCERCTMPLLSHVPSSGGAPSDFVADRHEHRAYVEGGHDDADVLRGGLARPVVVDDGLADLRYLRDLHERTRGGILRPRDLEITDAALRLHRVNCSKTWRRTRHSPNYSLAASPSPAGGGAQAEATYRTSRMGAREGDVQDPCLGRQR